MTFSWPTSPGEEGLRFVDLSHPWGQGIPAWPYFEDVKIERLHGMAKSRVLTQKITTVMHSGTHIDAPGHVVHCWMKSRWPTSSAPAWWCPFPRRSGVW
jgi:hypothetical protein